MTQADKLHMYIKRDKYFDDPYQYLIQSAGNQVLFTQTVVARNNCSHKKSSTVTNKCRDLY